MYSNSQTYTSLIRCLPTAVAFVSKEFELVDASNKWLSILKVKTSQIGKSALDLLPKKDINWKQILQNCFEANTPKDSVILKSFGKKSISLRVEILPWKAENSTAIIGAILQVEDITIELENESRYHRIENLLETKASLSKIGTWEYTLSTDELIWSKMTKSIFEVNSSFVPTLDNAINFYTRGHSRNRISMAVHAAISSQTDYSDKLLIKTAKGKEKWIITACKAIAKNGKTVKLVGTVQDITEQTAQDEKSKENENLLYTLINNIPINIYVKDRFSRKILVNKAETEFLGFENAEDLIGKTDYDLYSKREAEISIDEDNTVFKTKKPMLNKQTSTITKDGRTVSFLSSKIPLFDKNGEVEGLLGISIDISDLKRKENQLKNLINVTAVQNKKLLNFTHIISHNLRSHTANFAMLLDFLKREENQEEKQKIMEMLDSSSEGLTEAITSLNQVININSKEENSKEELHLKKVVEDVTQDLNNFIKEHKAIIHVDIPDNIKVVGVREFTDNIILNLLTNAIKYKQPGKQPEITIEIEKNGKETLLHVRDNGIGINLKLYQKKLFGMYMTFHNNPEARGIGLYICKNQAEAMGAEIFVQSEVNIGSTFSICFYE